MNKRLLSLFLGALLCALMLLPAWAQDLPSGQVTLFGVIQDTDFGLVLNDGQTNYLLLGVNDAQLEGKTCGVTGVVSRSLGIDAIDVEAIEIIGDTSDTNYTSELEPGHRVPVGRAA